MVESMKAWTLDRVDGAITTEIREVERPRPAADQALVKVVAAALNHRDQFIIEGKYAKIVYPAILGSDACGTVVATGPDADSALIGSSVIINPAFEWGADQRVKSPQFHILGMPTAGAFAEYVCVPADRLHPQPAHLTPEQAAALPLGGLTAYRAATTMGEIAPGAKTLVTGIGGGVAQFALQFAHALGARTYVTSGSDAKIARAVELGAGGGVNYRSEGWHKTLAADAGRFDVIIDSAGGDQLNVLLSLLNPGGKYVFFGATLGNPVSINLFAMFWHQTRMLGTTMGSDSEFAAMLRLVNERSIVPAVDSVQPFDNIESAFDRMRSGEHFGKIVVRIAQ